VTGSLSKIGLVLLLALQLGCAARLAPDPPGDEAPPSGHSSFDILLNGATLDTEPPRDQELRPPMLNAEPVLPVYPETALAAGAGPAIVAVRVHIDAEGRVAGFDHSPRLASTPGSFAAEFRRAVEVALGQWAFLPAVWRRFEPGEDLDGDGVVDYRRVLDTRAVSFYLDIRFDFEIIDGHGVVRSDQNR